MLTIEVINLRPANKTFFQDQTFQVCKLRKEINKLSRAGFNAEVVLSSPLTRALQTAYGAFYDQVNIYKRSGSAVPHVIKRGVWGSAPSTSRLLSTLASFPNKPSSFTMG